MTRPALVFVLMFLTGIIAAGAVLLTAVLTAKLGYCDPFVLPFGKWTWTINPWLHNRNDKKLTRRTSKGEKHGRRLRSTRTR